MCRQQKHMVETPFAAVQCPNMIATHVETIGERQNPMSAALNVSKFIRIRIRRE